MITVRREVRTTRPLEVVAAYLSDFTTTQQWDPHTERCRLLDGPASAPVEGARYENVQKLLGRRTEFVYTVSDLVPGRRIELRGTSKSVDAVDTMTFAPEAGGTRVVYEASFSFRGLLGRLGIVVRPLLHRIADDGADGMRAALQRL